MLALAGIAAIFCRCRDDPAAANPAIPLLTLRWSALWMKACALVEFWHVQAQTWANLSIVPAQHAATTSQTPRRPRVLAGERSTLTSRLRYKAEQLARSAAQCQSHFGLGPMSLFAVARIPCPRDAGLGHELNRGPNQLGEPGVLSSGLCVLRTLNRASAHGPGGSPIRNGPCVHPPSWRGGL
jgi:hypothetical protein